MAFSHDNSEINHFSDYILKIQRKTIRDKKNDLCSFTNNKENLSTIKLQDQSKFKKKKIIDKHDLSIIYKYQKYYQTINQCDNVLKSQGISNFLKSHVRRYSRWPLLSQGEDSIDRSIDRIYSRKNRVLK